MLAPSGKTSLHRSNLNKRGQPRPPQFWHGKRRRTCQLGRCRLYDTACSFFTQTIQLAFVESQQFICIPLWLYDLSVAKFNTLICSNPNETHGQVMREAVVTKMRNTTILFYSSHDKFGEVFFVTVFSEQIQENALKCSYHINEWRTTILKSPRRITCISIFLQS